MDENNRETEGTGCDGALLLKTWDDGEASIVRQILASYGIPCQVVSDIPHAVLPLSIDGLGEIRILVPSMRVEEARGLLAEHRREGLRILPGGRPAEPSDDPGTAEGSGGR